MKFLDLFAGIGGFRLGMEQAGHECVGYVEIDKFARKSYEAIYDTEGEWTAHDITSVTNDDIRSLRDRGYVDVICGGFPCQAFSVAGKRGGFNDTRGTLFFEIARFADILRPRYLFLENVKGLLNHDKGRTFETILRTLDELRYDAEWDCLNSKDFGVPQNRERVFIIGHSRRERTRKVFPVGGCGKEASDSSVTTGTLTTRYPASQREGTYIEEVRKPTGEIKIAGELNIKGQDIIKRVYDTEGISPSLTTMQGGHREPKIIDDQGRTKKKLKLLDVSPTLRRESHGNEPKVTDGYRIRKLTPRECWRLQGFPDWAFEKAAEVNSDSQLYKQAGNSVTVKVIYEIAKRL